MKTTQDTFRSISHSNPLYWVDYLFLTMILAQILWLAIMACNWIWNLIQRKLFPQFDETHDVMPMMVTFLLVPVPNSLQHQSPTQMLPTYKSDPKRAHWSFPTRWEIAQMSHFRRVLISTNQISLKFLNLFNRNLGKKENNG